MRPHRPAIAALLLAVAAACSESNAPLSPTPASLTLAGDPVYCDSCDTAAFDVVAGVDLSQGPKSPDPVGVSVVSGDTTHVEFKVVCGPLVGTAAVLMKYILGASPPPPVAVFFSTNYPLSCTPYGCVGYELDFSDGDQQGAVTVPSGTYAFVISPVPPGCVVTSPMPAYATVPEAGIGSVTFELDCR